MATLPNWAGIETWEFDEGRARTSSDVALDYRGLYPESWRLDFVGAAGVNDNDIVYTSPDVSMYNEHYIESTAGTVDVEICVDGTNFNTATPPVMLMTDQTAVGTYAATVAVNKIGILKMKCKYIRIRQNGASAANARGSHVVV